MPDSGNLWFIRLICESADIFISYSRADRDRFDLAEAHFESALKQSEELPFVSEQGEVRRWRAQMLLCRNEPGDRTQACELLQEASSLYAGYGMPKHRALVETILRDLN